MTPKPKKVVLEAPLPKRWSLFQHVKNALLYALIRTAYATVAAVPFPILRAAAIVLGPLAYWMAVRERRTALQNLARAFPELPADEHRRLAQQMFAHLTTSAMEAVHAKRFLVGRHAVELPKSCRALLDEALAHGRGVVLVTGHIGNWELCGQVFAYAGYPVTSIAKPLYDPRLTRFVHRLRTSFGARILWRGDVSLPKEMLRVFKENAILGILIDQDTRVQGDFVPFFGIPAHTPTAAASLALRNEAPVLVAWSQRTPTGGHQIQMECCAFTPSGNLDRDTLALTAVLSQRLEAAIRQAPAQWVWLHPRFKKQPPVVDTKGGALNNQPTTPAVSAGE